MITAQRDGQPIWMLKKSTIENPSTQKPALPNTWLFRVDVLRNNFNFKWH